MHLKNRIKYELMKLMTESSYVFSYTILIIIAIVAFLFWNKTDNISILLWVFSLYTIFLTRNFYVKKFLQESISFKSMYQIFVFLTFLSAFLVSSGFTFLFLHADYMHQVFIILMITAISAAAVLSLSYFKNLSITYLFILLLPIVYLLTKENFSILLLAIFFFVILSIFSIKNNKNITKILINKNKALLSKKALEVSQYNFESILREAPIGFITYNKDLILTYANQSFASLLRVEQKELLNLDMKTLKDTSIVEPLRQIFHNRKTHYEGKYQTTLKGIQKWIKLYAIPMYDSKGTIFSGLAMIEDNTKQIHYQEQLRLQIFSDSLTKLANKAAFQNHLEQFIKTLHRSEKYGILLFMDIDDFKNINNSLGYDVGDRVLQIFTQRIQKILRKEDIFARLGGDEFGILFSLTDPELSKINQLALSLVNRIHASMKEPIIIEKDILHISLSIGVKILVADEEDNDNTTILKHAGIAMYESKKSGKNKTSFYKNAMSTQIENQLLLHNELQIAIQKEQFELYLQPIVDLKTDKIVSAEALIRWNHPKKGLIFPEKFIEYAEDSSLIIDIGSWVIQKACQIYNTLNGTLESIAINISLKQFSQDNFEQLLLQNVQKYNINPKSIKLELTESITLNNIKKTIEKMLIIKQHGFKFSMDDFGTGYSSLSYLKNLPFDYLKIDQSFVRDMFENENDKKLVKIIIDMAQQFNFLVIAEGVETSEHVEFMRSNSCDYYQGYFLSKPIPLREFRQLIACHNSNLLN